MLAERFGELGPRTREALADRFGFLIEDDGDLGRLHALDADEQRHLAVGGGESGERALERVLGLRVGDRFERRALLAGRLARGQIAGELGAHGLGAGPAHDEPVGDREQPGAEPRVGREALRVLREPEEGLLEEVFRDIAAASHPHEVGIQPAAVGGERGVEGGRVTSPQIGDEAWIIDLRHRGATHHRHARDTSFPAKKSCHASREAAFVPAMVDFFRAGGFNMFVLAGLGVAMLWTAVRFARNADPQRLSLIRALTWVLVFASVTGFVVNLGATAKYVARLEPEDPVSALLMGFAESTANIALGGGIGVLTWLLVAVGVRRMPGDRS